MNSKNDELYNRRMYSPEMAVEIEGMGSMAVSIANRWMLGWPKRVGVLLQSDNYLESLKAQVDQEAVLLVNEANLRHLARHEILQMYEIRESPPVFG